MHLFYVISTDIKSGKNVITYCGATIKSIK